MPNADLQNQSFLEIRQRFVRKLIDWQPIYQKLADDLWQEKDVTEELGPVLMQTHKLAGSARTFGFPDLTTASIALERLLDSAIERPNSLATISELERCLAEFRQQMERVVSTQPSIKNRPQTPMANTAGDHPFTVLIADDDDLLRELLVHGLSDAHCNTIECDSGEKVLSLLGSVKRDPGLKLPDLIILDVNMPGLNGFSVLERLKSDPDLKSISVIMLTRRDEDESVFQGIASGAVDYVTKPFDVSQMVAQIKNILRNLETSILIVDDDELTCEMMRLRFQRSGYSVRTCSNGLTALGIIQNSVPNLILLDLMLPGLDGIALLKQIKSSPRTARISAVILSAKNQQENIIKGLEAGAHDYITKPFDIDEVAARVHGILLRQQAA